MASDTINKMIDFLGFRRIRCWKPATWAIWNWCQTPTFHFINRVFYGSYSLNEFYLFGRLIQIKINDRDMTEQIIQAREENCICKDERIKDKLDLADWSKRE